MMDRKISNKIITKIRLFVFLFLVVLSCVFAVYCAAVSDRRLVSSLVSVFGTSMLLGREIKIYSTFMKGREINENNM